MATQIGPQIGILGEKEFRASITAINGQLKSLGNEMKAVTAEFAGNESSMEALTAKSNVLRKSIEANENQMKVLSAQYDTQKSKLAALASELERAKKEFGETSAEAAKAQNAYNRQATAVTKLENDINKSRTSMAQLKSELSDVESQMDGTSGASDDLADSIEDAGDAADSSGGKFSAATVAIGNLAANAISAAVSAIGDLVSSLWNLDEATEEYRIAQGRLNTAYEAAGFSADTAQQAYRGFYGILGDTDTATEASQLLAQLARNEQDVATWTDIAAGVSGTFGDSLPIESLIEAANETAKTGTVTGTLADALNWGALAGETFGVTMKANTEANKEWNKAVQEAESAEDYFNLALQECSSESERQELIMSALTGAYDEASDAFYENNDALVQSREAQASLDETMASLGETIGSVKNTLAAALTPAVQSAAEAINDFLSGLDIEGVISTVTGVLGNLRDRFMEIASYLSTTFSPVLNALVGLWSALTEALRSVIDAFQNYIATGEAASPVTTALQTAIGALSGALTTVINALSAFISWLSSGTAGAEAFKAVIVAVGAAFLTWNVIQTISTMISTVTGVVTAAKAAFAAFNAVLAANPIGIVVTALAGLAAGFVYLWNNCEEFRQFWIDLFNGLVDAVMAAGEAISGWLQNVGQWFADTGQAIQDGFNSVVEFFSDAIENIKQWFVDAGEAIQDAWNNLIEFFTGAYEKIVEVFTPVAEVLTGFFTAAWEGIKAVWSPVIEFFQNIFNTITGIFSAIGALLRGDFQGAWDAIKGVFTGWSDYFTGLREKLLGVFSNVFNLFKAVGTNILNGIKAGVTGIVDVGRNIIEGLWNGINDMASWIGEKIQGFGHGVLNGIKNFFGIASPSKVMRDEVGVMLARGMAEGMTDGEKYVNRAAKKLGNAIEDEIAKTNAQIAKMEQEDAERQAAQELADYRQSIKDKYAEAAEAEPAEKQKILDEIAEMEAEWNAKQVEEAREAEKDKAEARLKELEDFQKEYEAGLAEIEKSQESMASKLSDYGDLFSSTPDGFELGDLQSDIDQIYAYGDAIESLQARGISDSLMDEILNMNVDDAIAYTTELLGMTDDEYAEYMALWEEKQRAAHEVAEKFYQDEMDALDKEFVGKIPEAISGLKDGLYEVGTSSAQGLAEGLKSMQSYVSQTAVSIIENALAAARAAMGVHSPSTVWAGFGENLAAGVGVGFEEQMRNVSYNMQQALPRPEDTFGNLAAGMVNGINTAMTGSSAPQSATIVLEVNGREFARAVVPDIRAVERSSPVVLSGV